VYKADAELVSVADESGNTLWDFPKRGMRTGQAVVDALTKRLTSDGAEDDRWGGLVLRAVYGDKIAI
jgi:hypothetical protein